MPPTVPERHQLFPERHQMFPERHQLFPERHQMFPERHHLFPERHQVFPERHHQAIMGKPAPAHKHLKEAISKAKPGGAQEVLDAIEVGL
jgi:hypothetical protein